MIPSAKRGRDRNETSYFFKLNPPLKLLSVKPTETFSDSEEELEMSYVFKANIQKKAGHLQKTILIVHQKKTVIQI